MRREWGRENGRESWVDRVWLALVHKFILCDNSERELFNTFIYFAA